jgi:menaquinone-dependent protoporphyrinogen IX oxidase
MSREEIKTMTVLVTYASKHGSTRGIAERISAKLQQMGKETDTERMMAKAVRAPEGDYRNWEAVDAWAESIARDL